MISKRRIAVSGIAILCLIGLAFAFSGRLLWFLGAILTSSGPPVKADMVVVIGGDLRANRIMQAAALVRDGYARKVLVSGSGEIYGRFESDLAVDYAVAHGYPRDVFDSLHFPALNTTDEAAADIAELRRLGVHKYLVVTSAWHTARAQRIFRRQAGDLEVHMVAAPDRYWADGQWWTSREGRKIWLYESLKTVADFLRI